MQKNEREVSLPVVRRLPRYYRCLTDLRKSGVTRISSIGIARLMGLTASQIRQDLNNFGGFGQRGYGYRVEALREEIKNILFLNEQLPAILIGVGNLGKALIGYLTTEAKGVALVGLFDQNPESVNQKRMPHPVMGMDMLDKYCKEHHPKIAILCISSPGAQALADHLVSLGVIGFWNFSHLDLHMPDHILVENVHLGDSLMALNFQVQSKLQQVEEETATEGKR